MKTIIPGILLTFSSVITFAQHDEFSWLIGKWKLHNKNVYEVWTASDDTALKGMSYKVSGTDTVFNEVITLLFKDDSFYYVPDVAGPQEPVYFRIINHDKTSFIAENQKHDFPKVIRYKQKPDDKKILLEAVIEGDGKSVSYLFERQK